MTAKLSRAPLRIHAAVGVLTILLPLMGADSVQAEDKNAASATPLLAKDLAGVPGKEVVMLTVGYLPGGASMPHRHDANVFVYVLEGSLIMQVEGQEPVTLKPGQTFYESPQDVHAKSANASATEPAKFLVFIVKDKGAPATRPVEPGKTR
jgi:quercetin dioxygenase-like cupin family protein